MPRLWISVSFFRACPDRENKERKHDFFQDLSDHVPSTRKTGDCPFSTHPRHLSPHPQTLSTNSRSNNLSTNLNIIPLKRAYFCAIFARVNIIS